MLSAGVDNFRLGNYQLFRVEYNKFANRKTNLVFYIDMNATVYVACAGMSVEYSCTETSLILFKVIIIENC